jgi:hypothetical protein
LAGHTVFEVGDATGKVDLTLSDGTALFLDRGFLVEVQR